MISERGPMVCRACGTDTNAEDVDAFFVLLEIEDPDNATATFTCARCTAKRSLELWSPGLHASTLAFPEIESDAFDNLCGRGGLMAEELTDELGEVTCPDCLRAIAEWGQIQAQAACGLALVFGQLLAEHEVLRADLNGAIAMLGSELAAKLLRQGGWRVGP